MDLKRPAQIVWGTLRRIMREEPNAVFQRRVDYWVLIYIAAVSRPLPGFLDRWRLWI